MTSSFQFQPHLPPEQLNVGLLSRSIRLGAYLGVRFDVANLLALQLKTSLCPKTSKIKLPLPQEVILRAYIIVKQLDC
eukprot:scaffold4736_cov434-Prasinococcus_capsulatus_cf.AAC.3